jgi:hypothetical protein
MELSVPRIPQCYGKLAAQPLPHSFVMIFPKVWDDFRITMSAEAMSLPNEFFAPFDIIE